MEDEWVDREQMDGRIREWDEGMDERTDGWEVEEWTENKWIDA